MVSDSLKFEIYVNGGTICLCFHYCHYASVSFCYENKPADFYEHELEKKNTEQC